MINNFLLNKCCLFAFLFTTTSTIIVGQNVDLDSLLEQESKKENVVNAQKTISTFKTTRLGNGQSVETLPAKILDIKIQHRFGYVSGGWNQFFGLDDATVRIGGDYGITDRLMIGGGRASYGKQWDAFAKYKILEQQSGEKNIPVSISLLGSVMLQTLPDTIDKAHFSDRFYFAGQIIIARKFGDKLSLQLMPTIVHYNLVPLSTDPNDIISIGAGLSTKISKRASLVLEYYYNLPGHDFDYAPGTTLKTRNSLSIGCDIETGGHVFQVLLTNAQGIAERPFITETTGDFWDGDISLGFNISRAFQLGKPKKKKNI
jgi:hypothetical protein